LGRRLLPQPILARLEQEYERHGTYGIFLSRLLPVWRAVVTPFAGIAGLSPARALLPVALASALWYGGVTALVVRLAPSLDAMLVQLGRVNRVLGAVTLLAAVALAFVVWRRLKR
jgi:membrane protein DedA with SNARE-associated domain